MLQASKPGEGTEQKAVGHILLFWRSVPALSVSTPELALIPLMAGQIPKCSASSPAHPLNPKLLFSGDLLQGPEKNQAARQGIDATAAGVCRALHKVTFGSVQRGFSSLSTPQKQFAVKCFPSWMWLQGLGEGLSSCLLCQAENLEGNWECGAQGDKAASVLCNHSIKSSYRLIFAHPHHVQT